MMDLDTLRFFEGRPKELALYEALLEKLRDLGEITPEVRKTQISLRRGGVFAAVSFTRVRKKAELPEHFLVVSLSGEAPPDSPRVVSVPVRPGRWTLHVILSSETELDGEFLGWVRASCALSRRGRRRA